MTTLQERIDMIKDAANMVAEAYQLYQEAVRGSGYKNRYLDQAFDEMIQGGIYCNHGDMDMFKMIEGMEADVQHEADEDEEAALDCILEAQAHREGWL